MNTLELACFFMPEKQAMVMTRMDIGRTDVLLLVAEGVVDEIHSGPTVGAKCQLLMHRQSYDLLEVVEDSRGKGGA